VHLGTPACRAADLLQFLETVTAEKLYLVGDIIDLERMKLKPHFPDVHRQVVGKFAELAARGTEVVYVPGNHDSEFRDLIGRELAGIPVMPETTHETRDGRRLLVTHGDLFDREIRQGTNLEAFGAAAYAMLLQIDVMVNQLRTRLGHDHLSISRNVKQRLASANEFIRRFERVASRHAARNGYDGIVCGHIHRPGLRRIEGVLYANDGDWVEHRTALAERLDGSLELLGWHRGEVTTQTVSENSRIAA
jgi:UDP-2,3-diacylglucosamine pyrophosphatase LpxH